MRIIFYVAEKDRNYGLAEALGQGARAHGDEVEIVPQRQFQGVRHDGDVAACLGLKRAGKRLLAQHLQAGKRFLFFDKGYMERANYVRVSIDSWQPLAYFRQNRPADRFDRLGVRIEPRRGEGKHVIFAGSSQKYANFHDLGDATAYAERVVRRLRKAMPEPRREVIYRPKPSWAANHPEECRPIVDATYAGPDKPLSHWLEGAHLLVTHGSNAAFDALAAGVPVMVLGNGICLPMSMGEDYGRIENPHWPSDEERHQFFCDVAYCQWTLEELRSGEAWEDMRKTLATLPAPGAALARDAEAEFQQLIEQYRIMHKSPKFFRGRETVKHFPKIWKLVLQTGSKTLLDYGSGKGEAYEAPLSLHEQLEVMPHCYDPGYERFSQMPKETGAGDDWDGKFDCVVCCDVMEHIPEASVPRVLRDIMSRARKFAFLSIATMPASKCLPNGMNCHVTVRPEAWWREQLDAARQAVNPGLVVQISVQSEPSPDNPDYADDD